MSALTFAGVGKDFGAVTAVAGLDLEVAAGEAVVLLGPSGCGKTTTLRLVAGFERPSRGEIGIDGELVAGPGVHVPAERREVGVVFQSYALWPHMTVAENVGFGLTTRRPVARAERSTRVEEALARVRLGGYGPRYPHELSGGQQQRVALARALVTRPRVLLLDEPLSNLDASLREEMRLEIRRLQRELATTMIYITHDRTEALTLADRVVVLARGRVQQVGTPEALYRRPRNEFVALAMGPANFLPGPRGTLCVRPPDIRLTAADGDGPSARSGTVRDAVFHGDEMHYLIDVPGLADPLRVVAGHAAPRHPRGSRVAFEVRDGASSLLVDEDTTDHA
ncbi:hypothetical protein GCM10023321_06080 [Pseudonocardia eucalypti]|uniref:ABC transporter domain-containing protein n=1 Tax=Pseudonocardia eucalypti TaxID=648755 RepID=A0ABP9PKS6_9PSEU|nr:ABC-type Fe3+/spermidine/putrescine transport system ATPase subunit [Pseudonocardia eucalypti]